MAPELLQDMPEHEVVGTNGTTNTHTTIDSITSNANAEQSDESNLEPTPLAAEPIEAVEAGEGEKAEKPANGELNLSPLLIQQLIKSSRRFTGAADSLDESTLSEDSLEPNTPIIANEETNDSDSHSSAKRWRHSKLTPNNRQVFQSFPFSIPSFFRSLDSEEHPETGEPELKKTKSSE